MWEITSITTETVSEEEFSAEEVFAEEKKFKFEWLEMIVEIFGEMIDCFDWNGYPVQIHLTQTVSEVLEELGDEKNTFTAEQNEKIAGFVSDKKSVHFFPSLIADETLYLSGFTLDDLEEAIYGLVAHEHRHVEQFQAFEKAGLPLEKVRKKVIAERNAYGYYYVILEQDAHAIEYGCCEWSLDDIVAHYSA